MYRITVLKYVNGVAYVAGVYFNEDDKQGLEGAKMRHSDEAHYYRVELAE